MGGPAGTHGEGLGFTPHGFAQPLPDLEPSRLQQGSGIGVDKREADSQLPGDGLPGDAGMAPHGLDDVAAMQARSLFPVLLGVDRGNHAVFP